MSEEKTIKLLQLVKNNYDSKANLDDNTDYFSIEFKFHRFNRADLKDFDKYSPFEWRVEPFSTKKVSIRIFFNHE